MSTDIDTFVKIKENERQNLVEYGDVLFTVKPGTQTDTKVRLKGKGMPSVRDKQIRGDHYVTLVVQVPKKLNNEQKEALRNFEEALNGDSPSDNRDGKNSPDGKNNQDNKDNKDGKDSKFKKFFSNKN